MIIITLSVLYAQKSWRPLAERSGAAVPGFYTRVPSSSRPQFIREYFIFRILMIIIIITIIHARRKQGTGII